MNFKECFRYQSFLDSMVTNAVTSIIPQSHSLTKTVTHHRKAVNSEAEDMTEICEDDMRNFTNDDVIAFMEELIKEKEKLSKAIFTAKTSCGFDIDSAIETNKMRHNVSDGIKGMLRNKSTKIVGKAQGRDYKFNAEGNQMPYLYDIETEFTEAFDRKKDKALMQRMLSDADKLSSEIDAVLINTQIDYEPPYDINSTFDDVMEEFLNKSK